MIGIETLSISEVACTVCPLYVLSCDLNGLSLGWLLWLEQHDSSGTTSVDDGFASPSYNFSSWDTWKHCKLGTLCPVYALDSSRITPLVEEVSKQDVIHFSQFPMSRASVSHRWGTSTEKRTSMYDQI
jgi:hypothetical protein